MRGVIICLTFILFASCNDHKARSGNITFDNPIEYNDFIIDQQNVIIEHMIALSRSYDKGEHDTIQEAFKSLVNACDSSRALIHNLTAYENDSTLKISAAELFNFYSNTFHKEYKEMLGIFLKGELASDTEILRLNNIVAYVRLKEEELNIKLTASQHSFSQKYGFKFE
jgi:hypothetical protein